MLCAYFLLVLRMYSCSRCLINISANIPYMDDPIGSLFVIFVVTFEIILSGDSLDCVNYLFYMRLYYYP